MPTEFPEFKHSQTGGVTPMAIQGRFKEPRARLDLDFTDADRAWRKQWLKDQILHDEPKYVPEHYWGTKNIFRRIYRAPFDALEKALIPKYGVEIAGVTRRVIGKGLIGYALVSAAVYYLTYHGTDWTRPRGFRIYKTEDICLPCHQDWPRKIKEKKPADYDSSGFQTRTTHLNPEIANYSSGR